jgi:hypothetical protein
MTWSNGTASKVADVIFDKGVMTPIDINVPLSGISSLYLQVTAGGRIFTSPTANVKEDFNFGMNSKFKYYGGQFEFNAVGKLEARGVSIQSDTTEYNSGLPWEHVGISLGPPHEPGDLVRVRWNPNISCTNCDSEEFKRCDDYGTCRKLRVDSIGHQVTLCAGCGGYPTPDQCLYPTIKTNSPVDMEVTPPKGDCLYRGDHLLFTVYTSICKDIYYESEGKWYSGGCDSWTSVELGW